MMVKGQRLKGKEIYFIFPFFPLAFNLYFDSRLRTIKRAMC